MLIKLAQTGKKYGSQLTINFEGVVDLHLSRRLLAEDGVHQHELVERHVPGFVGGKNPADPFPERILLKCSSGTKHFSLTTISRTVVFLSTMTDETSESETHSSNVGVLNMLCLRLHGCAYFYRKISSVAPPRGT